MNEQREQPKDERPEAAGEVDDAELEQTSGGLTAGTYGRGSAHAIMAEWTTAGAD